MCVDVERKFVRVPYGQVRAYVVIVQSGLRVRVWGVSLHAPLGARII